MKNNGCKIVLFDLDGTLLNTLGDLADAINHTMRTLGHPEKTDAEVLAAIGNGIRRAVATVLPGEPDEAETDRALGIFRERYNANFKVRTRPYAGVSELVKKLRDDGCKIGVVSNKSDMFTRELVDTHFAGTVDHAVGERAGVPLKPAPDAVFDVLNAITGDNAITAGDAIIGDNADGNSIRAVYVGDSDVDFATARNAGLPCVLVSWGFRSRDALLAAGAAKDMIADTPEQVYDRIVSLIG